MLLVDSEDAVNDKSPWAHLTHRVGDQWPTPTHATDDHCHLMVQCMESWILSDRNTLSKFFGQGFNVNALPTESKSIESIPKESTYQTLKDATRDCKTKKPYHKGNHSFQLLALIDPDKVSAASPWANRFITTLGQVMGVNAVMSA